MPTELNNESGIKVDERGLVEQAEFMMQRLYVNPASELSIQLIDEAAMAELHEQWMDEPGATDVLSFPMDELRAGKPDEVSEGILGDIVLCPEFAVRQAATAGHDLGAELRLLLTHGLLHLLGHDHAQPDEHTVMFGLQAQLLGEWEAERSRRGY